MHFRGRPPHPQHLLVHVWGGVGYPHEILELVPGRGGVLPDVSELHWGGGAYPTLDPRALCGVGGVPHPRSQSFQGVGSADLDQLDHVCVTALPTPNVIPRRQGGWVNPGRNCRQASSLNSRRRRSGSRGLPRALRSARRRRSLQPRARRMQTRASLHVDVRAARRTSQWREIPTRSTSGSLNNSITIGMTRSKYTSPAGPANYNSEREGSAGTRWPNSANRIEARARQRRPLLLRPESPAIPSRPCSSRWLWGRSFGPTQSVDPVVQAQDAIEYRLTDGFVDFRDRPHAVGQLLPRFRGAHRAIRRRPRLRRAATSSSPRTRLVQHLIQGSRHTARCGPSHPLQPGPSPDRQTIA